MSTPTTDFAAIFPDEVVTRALVRDVELPGGGGTLALVTLDNGHDHRRPSTFGPQTLQGLADVVGELERRAAAGEIAAVAFTGKPFMFAVGADLKGVSAVTRREDARAIAAIGHGVFARISALPVPTFAFVNGAAMGGGVELALSCDYRTVAASVPAIALPECFLGLVPGWGGTWMLPNLVGVEKAVKVILENPMANNKMLTGRQAAQLGLMDVVQPDADFLVESVRWAADVLAGRTSVQRADVDRDETRWNAVLDHAKKTLDQRTGGKAPAPYRAVELMRAARTATREEGYEAENEALADLLMGDELRAGLYAFDLVQRRAKRPGGAPDKALARPVTKVGVVGAGLMASQLALLFVRRLQVPVVMTDLDEERAAKGVGYVHAELDALAAKGRLDPARLGRYKALVTGTADNSALADADLVIEAVFEEMSVKKAVLADLEKVVSPECVLATNTSSLSITTMAVDLEHPQRVIGLHFFNPVAVMPLLEIIRADATDEATLATGFAVGKKLKKTCILVKDAPSFVVNRLLGRFMSEVGRIVDEGTPVDVVERSFAGVAPMPPFVLMGLVGPAIALHNNETLAAAFPDRFTVSPTLKRVVDAGLRGFYTTDERGRPVPDPAALALVERPEEPTVLSADQVRTTVLEALADEARRMLDEGVVSSPLDIDLAMITGAGFSFWNGGLLPLLDRDGHSAAVGRFLPPGAASAPRG